MKHLTEPDMENNLQRIENVEVVIAYCASKTCTCTSLHLTFYWFLDQEKVHKLTASCYFLFCVLLTQVAYIDW